MKVRELIQKLSVYNLDADVTTPFSEDITLSFICKDDNGNVFSEKTTMLVFIEPCDSCPSCVHRDDEGLCGFYGKPCADVEECYQFEELE